MGSKLLLNSILTRREGREVKPLPFVATIGTLRDIAHNDVGTLRFASICKFILTFSRGMPSDLHTPSSSLHN
jgi:hypothetical protein